MLDTLSFKDPYCVGFQVAPLQSAIFPADVREVVTQMLYCFEVGVKFNFQRINRITKILKRVSALFARLSPIWNFYFCSFQDYCTTYDIREQLRLYASVIYQNKNCVRTMCVRHQSCLLTIFTRFSVERRMLKFSALLNWKINVRCETWNFCFQHHEPWLLWRTEWVLILTQHLFFSLHKFEIFDNILPASFSWREMKNEISCHHHSSAEWKLIILLTIRTRSRRCEWEMTKDYTE